MNALYDKRSEVFSPDNHSVASEKLAHLPHSTAQSATPRRNFPKQVSKQAEKVAAVVPSHVLPKRVLPKPAVQKRSIPLKQAFAKPTTPPPPVVSRAKTAKRRKPKTTFLTHDPMVFDSPEDEPENQVNVPVTPLRPARETTRVEIDQKTPTRSKSQVSKIPRKSPQKSPEKSFQKPPQESPQKTPQKSPQKPPQKPPQKELFRKSSTKNSIELAKSNRSRKNSQTASNRDSKNDSNHDDLPENTTELVTSAHSFHNHKANDIQCVQAFVSDYINLIIFGDFQNNCRPKNRNFQNFLSGSPFGLLFLADNNSKKLPK